MSNWKHIGCLSGALLPVIRSQATGIPHSPGDDASHPHDRAA